MLRVMIVEDERPILGLMELLVGRHPMLEAVGAYTSPLIALERFGELKPDAVFLDVEMPRLGGIELAEKLKAMDEEVQIVFTTAYPNYAVEAFRVSAVDYLLKPVTPDALERVAARLAKNQALRSAIRSAPVPGERAPVRCLGTFETRGLDGQLMSWPTRKTEELFAYLIAYPDRLAGKWQLADLLWPEMDEERALHNVHNTVYRLKKALKEAGLAVDVTHTNEGYRMQTPKGFSDLERLRDVKGRLAAISDERDAAEATEAFGSYAGELFGGKDYPWSVGVAAEAASHHGALARMLAAWHREQGGGLDAAKEVLRAYLGLAPLDEEMNAALLRLYADGGEAGMFRRHYEGYSKLLADELGIAPAAELRELAARLSL
ncbi:response regulator [Cohnella yongneupensis]|uniref:Response regulator n=1 Tax=Cohnella yongneupensis TaxID=425006 RepID=A0ABW0R0W1_9BACL